MIKIYPKKNWKNMKKNKIESNNNIYTHKKIENIENVEKKIKLI